MNVERDVTRIVRRWLRTEEHDFPTEIVDSVLGRLDATPQDRPRWSARRLLDMRGYARFGIGAAVGVVLALVAINLVPAPGSGGRTPGVSASPIPPSTAAPSATRLPIGVVSTGLLGPGRRSVSLDEVAFSVDMPTAWEVHPFYLSRNTVGPQGAEGMVFWTMYPGGAGYVRCIDLLGPASDSSVAAIAEALLVAPGVDVTRDANVTIGGRAAKHVALSVHDVDPSAICQPGFLYSFDTDAGGGIWNLIVPGDTIDVWIVDMGESPLLVVGATHARMGAAPALQEEIRQLVGSIEFE